MTSPLSLQAAPPGEAVQQDVPQDDVVGVAQAQVGEQKTQEPAGIPHTARHGQHGDTSGVEAPPSYPLLQSQAAGSAARPIH